MYYILNETNQIIAADDNLLTLCEVSHIDELSSSIALGDTKFDLISDEDMIMSMGSTDETFSIVKTSLSSMLGSLTLVQMSVAPETVETETNLIDSILEDDISIGMDEKSPIDLEEDSLTDNITFEDHLSLDDDIMTLSNTSTKQDEDSDTLTDDDTMEDETLDLSEEEPTLTLETDKEDESLVDIADSIVTITDASDEEPLKLFEDENELLDILEEKTDETIETIEDSTNATIDTSDEEPLKLFEDENELLDILEEKTDETIETIEDSTNATIDTSDEEPLKLFEDESELLDILEEKTDDTIEEPIDTIMDTSDEEPLKLFEDETPQVEIETISVDTNEITYDTSEIIINTDVVSQKIGISNEDYKLFLNEYIDTALGLEKDLQSTEKEKHSNAIATLLNLSTVLHIPIIGDIITNIKTASPDTQRESIESFYSTLARITTSVPSDVIFDTEAPKVEESFELAEESITTEKPELEESLDLFEDPITMKESELEDEESLALFNEPVTSEESELEDEESLALFDEPITMKEPELAIEPKKEVYPNSFGTIDLEGIQPKHFDFQLEEAANDLSLPVELIEEFVHDFVDQARIETTKMLEAYEKGDLDTIQQIGHLLKGASSNLRINALSDTLYQIQFCEDSSLLEDYIKDYWAHFLSFEFQINMISN